jgi:hypothetical protein
METPGHGLPSTTTCFIGFDRNTETHDNEGEDEGK